MTDSELGYITNTLHYPTPDTAISYACMCCLWWLAILECLEDYQRAAMTVERKHFYFIACYNKQLPQVLVTLSGTTAYNKYNVVVWDFCTWWKNLHTYIHVRYAMNWKFCLGIIIGTPTHKNSCY